MSVSSFSHLPLLMPNLGPGISLEGMMLKLKLQYFEQALGVGDGQGSLACFCPCDCKESDMTE